MLRAVLLAALVALTLAETCEEKCASCPALERSQCLAGVSKDAQCGCCDVCLQFEGEKCDLEGAAPKHGNCGDGLKCRKTAGGNVCQCLWEEIICGTDGKTYSNLCHLMSSSVRDGNLELEVKNVGPCEPKASIVTAPEYVKNATHSNVFLSCEAIGFPAPTIRWQVTRANAKTTDCPGDDGHIVTAVRGGPAKYMATGWLQIEGLQKRHEGDYTCIAQNEAGTAEAKARIKVSN